MKTVRWWLILILGLAMALTYGNVAYAADDTAVSALSFTVPDLVNIDIANPDQTPTITGTELAAGLIELTADQPTLTITANNSWELKIKAGAWTAPGSKAVSDLQFKHSNATYVANSFDSYVGLTTSDVVIGEHASTPVVTEDFVGRYKILLDASTDVAGSYSISVTFTITAPHS